ncbi:hypothetical protein C9I57_05290 [Trinickia symbiotica]|uniref:BrnT family toxin n=1 Tax=Trinickia symbiotica TaxID=863227 RepID=A0A2T3XZS1_9BURK|nr:BrnT family toxin [Trinickia symbiotica]PTB22024.1 hypothetical protein C9I57_05290 [Trinickia symbiotica]
MEITFDPNKSASNLRKHGVPLTYAARLDWNALRVDQDERVDYSEDRYIGFGPIDGRLYCVVFTYRGDAIRIISLRKANKREQRDYEQA